MAANSRHKSVHLARWRESEIACPAVCAILGAAQRAYDVHWVLLVETAILELWSRDMVATVVDTIP